MFKNLKLGTKLNLLLLLIFLGVVGTSGLALSKILGDNAKEKVASQAFLLLETMSSVRDYTATQVNPELAPRLEREDWFIPQTVPAYSAREVFEKLRKREQYSNFFYKEATLNPTNPRDKTDSFESSIVEKFRNQSALKEVTGFRSLPSGELFYVARPLVISEQSCLRCHSTPEQAPKSQLATYGRDNGFGWKLNEIIGARIISVPSSAVFNEARRLQILVIGSLSVFFLLAMIIINLFLKFAVTKPLKRMAQLSKQVSTGDMKGEFEHSSHDEIGILAASLNRMKVSLEMAMNMLNTEIQE
ncbi:c-type heme family protein [Allocoleopsis sp.]|uniref:c-type heme family protein n=1 Tax=Allocoleopsis sp. TaxID=3088169 RepID=UPI002FCEEB37